MTDATVRNDHHFAKETIPVSLEEEMRRSYLDYAMSVIVGRALPDVRDGLKPVHRRVLYIMHDMKNNWNLPHKKSARIVGDVMGRLHPHGDSAIYDTIVRMAQDFSMRYLLVDGQGNFGSVDGDAPAAMRYTEIRMEKLTHEMLADIEEETVDFSPNYDGNEKEPQVLPTRFPALLVNGSSGIAVGMATNIPPHNLSDTVAACLKLLHEPETDIDTLIDIIRAPDFPTGGTIYGLSGVREGYKTGRGRVVIRGKSHVEPIGKNGERQAVIIDELPYQVNKAKLVEKIGDLVREKALEGVSDLRDESDKDGIRIAIELKRNENPEVVLNQLYKLTPLQDSFGINMVALVDGQPRLLNLKQVLGEFLRHRREVVTRRTLFRLKKARHEGHIAEGKAVALSNMDEMIALIRNSDDAAAAKEALTGRAWAAGLVSELLDRGGADAQASRPQDLPAGVGFCEDGYYLSDMQADAVLRMSLRNLTGLDREAILADYREIMVQIVDLLDILARPERITGIIGSELAELRDKVHQDLLDRQAKAESLRRNNALKAKKEYVRREPAGDVRLSEINAFGGDIADEDLIPQREMVVTLTHGGYIKTQPTTDYQAQRRGGRGRQAAATKDEDFIETLFVANTHDYLMCFTNYGKCHWIKVYRLPEGGRNSRGRPINNVIQLDEGEKVSAILAVRDFPDDQYVFFATAQGMVKKVRLSAFKHVRAQGIKAIALKEGDYLVGAVKTGGADDIMLFSNLGKALRFNEYWETSAGAADDGDEAQEGGEDVAADGENAPSGGKYGVRPSGRGSGGSRGMSLPGGGRIVSLITFPPECVQDGLQVLTATAKGYGKRTPIDGYSRKNRGGQGNIAINTGGRNGELVAAALVGVADDVMLITSGGVLIRTGVGEIRETGRTAAGVKLINLDEGETLVSLERVAEEPGGVPADDGGEDGDAAHV
ncbi:MAG: DNA gyrase subunit A [Neisseria sp.]|nr:DNA gyrase subunit A [Neisseria sp.]